MSTSYLPEEHLTRRAKELGLFIYITGGDYRVCDLKANTLFQGDIDRCSDFVRGFEAGRAAGK